MSWDTNGLWNFPPYIFCLVGHLDSVLLILKGTWNFMSEVPTSLWQFPPLFFMYVFSYMCVGLPRVHLLLFLYLSLTLISIALMWSLFLIFLKIVWLIKVGEKFSWVGFVSIELCLTCRPHFPFHSTQPLQQCYRCTFFLSSLCSFFTLPLSLFWCLSCKHFDVLESRIFYLFLVNFRE